MIKLRNPEEAGEKIVVQGGTFLNNAVLRSIEKILGKDVIRPDIAGIMGAYGAAVIAKDNYVVGTESSILELNEINNFKVEHTHTRCGACENNCMLTINSFNDGSKFITGNRCEKGAGKDKNENKLQNLYQYKFNRLFDYEPLSEVMSTRGVAL